MKEDNRTLVNEQKLCQRRTKPYGRRLEFLGKEQEHCVSTSIVNKRQQNCEKRMIQSWKETMEYCKKNKRRVDRQ